MVNGACNVYAKLITLLSVFADMLAVMIKFCDSDIETCRGVGLGRLLFSVVI